MYSKNMFHIIKSEYNLLFKQNKTARYRDEIGKGLFRTLIESNKEDLSVILSVLEYIFSFFYPMKSL